MTYTTETDIEAMASEIASLYTNKPQGWRPSPTEAAKAALAASPVHAELARMKAENERLCRVLRFVKDIDKPEGYDAAQWRITSEQQSEAAADVLAEIEQQQKGGGDDR